MSKVRSGGSEEITHVRGKEQRLCFAGAAVKRYPTSKVRETQVRQQALRGGIRGQTLKPQSQKTSQSNHMDHSLDRLNETEPYRHPIPVLLPGKFHGRRSLVGCSPWGHEEQDTTEQLHFHFSLSCIGEGNGNPLQYSCLENPRDKGAWWAAVYGVAQSQTRLKRLSSSSSSIVFIFKNPHINGPMQFKSVLFKAQLYTVIKFM